VSKGEPVQVAPNPLQGNVPAILSVFLHNQSIKPMLCSSNLVRIPALSTNQTYTVFQQPCPYSCTINQSNLCRIPVQSINQTYVYSSNFVRIPTQSINQTYAYSSNPVRFPVQSINQTYTYTSNPVRIPV
jgi:hypothetical protein